MSKLDIKEIWKKQPKAQITDEELKKLRLAKSENFLEKLKKRAKTEHYANIVGSILVVFYIGYEVNFIWAGVTALIMGGIVYYYYTLYKEIWAIEPTSDVRVFLNHILDKMNVFLRRYYIGILLIFPLAFFFGINLGKDEATDWPSLLAPGNLWKLGVGIFISLCIIYPVVYLLYGNIVRKLKSLLRSLDEE